MDLSVRPTPPRTPGSAPCQALGRWFGSARCFRALELWGCVSVGLDIAPHICIYVYIYVYIYIGILYKHIQAHSSKRSFLFFLWVEGGRDVL